MRLKTLNKIEWFERGFSEFPKKLDAQVRYKLKQEAIKDINIIKEAMENQYDLNWLHKPTGEEYIAIKSYLMNKFDLQGEDLK